ncbi:VWA domain-containing protein [Gordonia sp. TBRC 11910]|uniref:VWA domain-containing protein n=1 Tax=Gordonia asplenii TaxID=2725283 RepID=A0A848L5M1_9ACTN|nr:VWA domain-containing protein [Gordonia asplenii]NMO03851.1 VWA domain-containing protein [Gordonia asplenii]
MSELDRWRLVLGRFGEQRLGQASAGSLDARRGQALDYLYGRAYDGRGVDTDDAAPDGPGGQGASDPRSILWLGEVRALFDDTVGEVIVGHALNRFGLTDLVTDPEVLASLEPSTDLLALLLSLRRSMPRELDAQLRRIIREVVDDIRRRLESDIRRVLVGHRRRFNHSPMPSAANLDIPGTIVRNLKNFDPELGRLIIDDVRFFDRQAKHLAWEVILCVDQSGSMANSMIHSAVMAGILAGIGTMKVHLVVFDTAVVDLTQFADDPVEVLMTVQLGGGTDIGGALRYCAGLSTNPQRTVLVLITDFFEGSSPAELIRVTGDIASSGVHLLGLASLAQQSDSASTPLYDRSMAQQLADVGMQIAALTPRGLADWLVEVTS